MDTRGTIELAAKIGSIEPAACNGLAARGVRPNSAWIDVWPGDARAAKALQMNARLRPRTSAKKPHATVRKLTAVDIRSMPKKPPAPSVRHRRGWLRFYSDGKVICD
jgi:hypothetical protein